MSSSPLAYTATGSIAPTVAAARAYFKTGATLDVVYRQQQLRQLAQLLQDNIDSFVETLHLDLNKPRQECITAEIDNTISDALKAAAALPSWAAAQRPSVDAVNMLDGCQIQSQPYGTTLIIGAWNYPVLLVFKPLVGAIAAGNTAVVKPSEVSAHTAALITRLLPQYLDTKAYHVVNGGVVETTELLAQPFDFIMYTGNGQVGRVVAAAAAKNLTPICLELGGKSPVVVDCNTDIKMSARRVMWGRCLNAGQTCIAADYVLCHHTVAEAFAAACVEVLAEFFGSDGAKTEENLSRIVAERHFDRLADMLKRSKGKVVAGGLDKSNRSKLIFAPTVVTGVQPGDSLLTDEIFGPILPIVPVKSIEDAIEYINSHDKPLALYVFSKSSSVVNKVLSLTTSGGAVANDCLMQVSVSSLPFGGVGPSGCGAYHGKASFELFSHKRSVMIKSQNPLLHLESLNAMRYPPYSQNKLRWLQRLVFAHRRPGYLAPLGALIVAAVAVLAMYPDFARNIVQKFGFGAK